MYKRQVNDPFIEKELKTIQDNLDRTFISDYEIAAQNILRYLKPVSYTHLDVYKRQAPDLYLR